MCIIARGFIAILGLRKKRGLFISTRISLSVDTSIGSKVMFVHVPAGVTIIKVTGLRNSI